MPTSGLIYIDGNRIGTSAGGVDTPVTYRDSELRKVRVDVGMVFQHFNLFPHMTALQNIMEGPVTVLCLKRAQAEERARILLDKVGLGEKADEYPARPSGGQRSEERRAGKDWGMCVN